MQKDQNLNEKIKEETKPKKKWDVINDDFLKTLKKKGHDISLAVSDPTQALIVVPQKLAISTIGRLELTEILSELKKGTYEQSRNICINHLNSNLRTYFLKSSTHEYLKREYNVLANVRGNYREDIEGTEYFNEDNGKHNHSKNKTENNMNNKLPLHLVLKGDSSKELDSAMFAIQEMFNGNLTIQEIQKRFRNGLGYKNCPYMYKAI